MTVKLLTATEARSLSTPEYGAGLTNEKGAVANAIKEAATGGVNNIVCRVKIEYFNDIMTWLDSAEYKLRLDPRDTPTGPFRFIVISWQ